MQAMNHPSPISLNVVILAAGKGTRMFSDQPKVLHALAGKPLLEHVVETARGLSPESVTVVYGFGGSRVREAIQAEDLRFVLQEPQLGTGHAVKMAMKGIPGTGRTLILYGDVPLIGRDTLERLMSLEDSMGLLTVILADPHGYGRIVRDGNGSILKIVEEKDASAAEKAIDEVNTGVMIVPTHLLSGWLENLSNDNAQGEYYLTDIVSMAVDAGVGIGSVQPAHEWEVLGVNNKTQLAGLERVYQDRAAEHLMAKGVGLADPSRIDIRGSLECGRDVFIDVNCLFEGRVEVGDRVRIGANCVISDAVIASDTEIEPFSLIEGASIGRHSRIGPYARIRPGTDLADDVRIGNFVEVKNSSIDSGSRANHLSYIGDSSVGKRVNVGAGTITCNYDGAKKHRTVIEDDVFIGSDTQLVAPVTVGRGATIGAGSTITRDAPEGGLTLSRSKQMHISYWQRPKKD